MSEFPPFPLWVTVFLTIWAAVGPLARWLADNRKIEFRRVLAALNKINILMIELHNSGIGNPLAVKEAMDQSTEALNTSLFINDFLEHSQVAGDIVNAVKKLNNGGSFDDYQKEYWKAINLILDAASKSTL